MEILKNKFFIWFQSILEWRRIYRCCPLQREFSTLCQSFVLSQSTSQNIFSWTFWTSFIFWSNQKYSSRWRTEYWLRWNVLEPKRLWLCVWSCFLPILTINPRVLKISLHNKHEKLFFVTFLDV
jgi:hypothetical protein